MDRTEILQACKRLLAALEIEAPQIDDLIRIDYLRRKSCWNESELDELIELLNAHHDLLCMRW